MTIEIAILLAIIASSTTLFVLEVFSVDKVAILTMVSMLVFGLINAEEAISGFSNPAVITILCLMILASALEANGSIKFLANGLYPLMNQRIIWSLPILMLIVGSISAFISTTAVVIIFVKMMPEIARRYKINVQRIMMPISFAGIMGGSCTLMGTSTNLIVNQMAIDQGFVGFDFFDLTKIGMVMLSIGILSMTISTLLSFKKSKVSGEESSTPPSYITELTITPDSTLINKEYKDTRLYTTPETRILTVKRSGNIIKSPPFFFTFLEGDVLVLRTDFEELLRIKESKELGTIENANNDRILETSKIIEVLILPSSRLLGKSFSEISYKDLKGGMPIAIKKHKNILNPSNQLISNRLSRVRLDVGDRLIVEIDKKEANWTLEDEDGVFAREMQENYKNKSPIICLAILSIVILLAAVGVVDILKSVLLGLGLLIVTRCITLEKAYSNVNWQVIFLLAGLMPLGIAMQNTGTSAWLSEILSISLDGVAPRVLVSILMGLSILTSGVLSNNATAIIFTPIAVAVAQSIGIQPEGLLIAIMLGSNYSFFTPIGYQTNTIIYGMGIYRFRDFLTNGGLLTLLLWISGSILIPILFPM